LRDAEAVQATLIDGGSTATAGSMGPWRAASCRVSLGGAEKDVSEHPADCSNEGLWRAKPGVACRSFTQGANPLGRRRRGF